MIRIGVQPICWTNDDFPQLGGSTPLETCLEEMKQAGYEGTELGCKFPRDAGELKQILSRHGLELVSGWHSAYILTRELSEELESFRAHLRFLKQMGSPVAIVAECSGRTYNDPAKPLEFENRSLKLTEGQWSRLTKGLDQLAEEAEREGMRLVYHYHMGTVVQDSEDIRQLMKRTKKTWLLLDTGHLAFAGGDPLEIVKKHGARIGHVHLKNVRPAVLEQARREQWSFERAVSQGVFTVPGDGGLDYGPILKSLQDQGYEGWWVVEAEQDPEIAHPLTYVRRGRETIRELAGI